jgi:hypothetical protein
LVGGFVEGVGVDVGRIVEWIEHGDSLIT